MADDTKWYSGDYFIYWANDRAPYENKYVRPGVGEQDDYDIQITDGGVLRLRPKKGDYIIVCPPHSYKWVDLMNVSVAKSGKAAFV